MKYFAIRLSLVINFVMIMLFLCIDLDYTQFKYVLYYAGATTVLTIINSVIMTKVYSKKERDEIFLINNNE